MAKMSSQKVLRAQQKEQEKRMIYAFTQWTEETKREIPDGIIASMMKMSQSNAFKSNEEALADLKTLFELYDEAHKELRVVDAET